MRWEKREVSENAPPCSRAPLPFLHPPSFPGGSPSPSQPIPPGPLLPPPSWALHLAPRVPGGAGSRMLRGPISDSSPSSILSTFVDCEEALPDPVAAAAEFNPEAAVGGDDRLGEFAPTEAACADGVDKEAGGPEVSPSPLLAPGLSFQEVCPTCLGGSGALAYIPKTAHPSVGLYRVLGPAWP